MKTPTKTNVDICVCAFRRPQIRDTLSSLADLDLAENISIRVIVADNDDSPKAKDFIEECAKNHNLDLLYVHAPARNISIARNACLDHVRAPFAAFIDDDETAPPQWLKALLHKQKESAAAAVLGPVQAIYDAHAPRWMKTEDFHSIMPVWVEGEIITGYTSNVLLDMSIPQIKSLRFREELGTTGGEDSAFFAALNQMGYQIAFAPEAGITELIPPQRACFSWIAKRRFRMGQTHAMMLMEKQGSSFLARLKNIALAAAKVMACLMGALGNVLKPGRRAFWLLRGMLHIGVIFKLCGKKDITQYGQG